MIVKNIILTRNEPEDRIRLLHEAFYLCPCVEFPQSDWLSYFNDNGNESIHGEGYDIGLLCKYTPDAQHWANIKESVAHGHSVILCANVDDFIKYIKQFREEYDNDIKA